MRVLLLGNTSTPHSTESHLVRAWEANGHEVIVVQESPVAFQAVPRQAARHHVDLVQWVHTHGLAPEATHPRQQQMLDQLAALGVPTVAYHLDRWWGLDREAQVFDEPFFRCDLVCTADGGHDAEWAKAGVNHRWFPPAVLADECQGGRFRAEFESPIAFVGSWQGGYHDEASHRHELVRFLRDNYGDRTRFWPRPGEQAVRGRDLCDLYRSIDLAIGDSCLIREPNGRWTDRYVSDRVPESTGRGACFMHPEVEGVIGIAPDDLWHGSGYDGERHLVSWPMGNWDLLGARIDYMLSNPVEAQRTAQAGRVHTLEHHTYERRMVQLVDLMIAEGML